MVTLTLLEEEQALRIQIADNGPGVPETIRQKIFLPFVSEGRESGVGLGLTLAQQIAQEHGGRIELGETAEHYTSFTIVLPKTALRGAENLIEKKVERTQAHTF